MEKENFQYYVYVYLDTRKICNEYYLGYYFKYKPFYVGKGKGDRYLNHLTEVGSTNRHKYNTINKIIKQTGKILKIIILKENISQLEALKLEKYLIKEIGINNLTNMTEGGIGGDTYTYMEENKRNIRKSKASESMKEENHYLNKFDKEKRIDFLYKHRKGKNNPMYGCKHSKEFKKLHSNFMLNNNPFKGKKHLEETKEKMSKNSKDKNKGNKNCNYGKFGHLNHRAKKYTIITPKGEKFVIKGLAQFCRDLDLTPQNMSAVAKGICKQHKKYKCFYYEGG